MPSPCTAWDRRAFPSRTPLCSASSLRCRAGLRHRVILHFKAVAWQISEELCLSFATLRFAFATLCSAKQRLRCPHQSIAVACRGFASPLPRGALLCVTVAVRCRSFAEPFVSLPILRQSPLCCAVAFAPHCLALPSPRSTSQCLSFADLGSAVHFRRVAGQSKAFPSPSLATHFLRSSRLSRASPSPGCATPCSSLPSLA